MDEEVCSQLWLDGARGIANDRCFGYLQKTNEGNLQPHAGWPQTPESIAQLLSMSYVTH